MDAKGSRITVLAEPTDIEAHRFNIKWLGCMAKGGIHLASIYLHTSIGIAHPRNLNLL